MKTIKIKFPREEFEKFLKVINELNSIEETHKIKVLDDSILIYTIDGEEETGKINALKVFHIKRDKLFSNLKPEILFDFTLVLGKAFVKKFTFLLDSKDSEFECEIEYDEEMRLVNSFEMKNTELNVRCIAGHETEIKDFTVDKKKELMDPSMADFSFELSVEVLAKIKKLSKIDNLNEVITFKIEDGVASFSEAQWELKVKDDIESKNMICSFHKKFLNSIVSIKDIVEFQVFPSYILINEFKSQYLFNLELQD
jgi:hypothetical protein